MNMRISGAKLPRLNTIIATQAERVKLAETLKSQYNDADQISVKDNGGLHLDYTPIFGGTPRVHSIRIPRTAVEKFFEVEENRELDPVATATLKAQLDAWVDGAVAGQSLVFTENDVVELTTSFGLPTLTKFIVNYQVNGAIIEGAIPRTKSFVAARRPVTINQTGPIVIPHTERKAITTAILAAVNGSDELEATDPQLFADEIVLPVGRLVEGNTYVAQIDRFALDYFGQLEFTIGEVTETEEPVDPVEAAFFTAPENLILNNKSGQVIDPASIHNVVYAPVYDATTKTTMINLDLAASQDTLFDMETYIYIGDAEFEAMLNQKIADGSTDVLFRIFSPVAPEQFLDVRAENINNNPLLMTAQINGRLALRVPVHQDLPSGLYSLAFSDDGFVTTCETHTYGWQTNLTVKPDPLESVYLGGQESIRGKQGATMDLRLSLTPDDAEIDSVVWEVTPATGLTITPTEDGLYATLIVDQDFDETTAGNVTLTATVNGTTTIVKTLVIAVTTHDAVVVPLIRFDTNNPTVGTTLYNYIDFLPYENQEIKSTEFTFSPAENVEVISATDGYFKPLVPGEITVGLTVILQDDTELTTSQTVHAVE